MKIFSLFFGWGFVLLFCVSLAAQENKKTMVLTQDSLFKWSGAYRLRGEHKKNFSAISSDRMEHYEHRLFLAGAFYPNDYLKLNLKLNFNGILGGEGHIRGYGGHLGSDEDKYAAQVLEAFLHWDVGGGFFFDFGRKPMNWGNGVVFSKNMQDLRPYSFDGGVLGYASDSFEFQAGALKIGDWPSTMGVGDIDPEEDAFFVLSRLHSLSHYFKFLEVFYLRTQRDGYVNHSQGTSYSTQALGNIGLSFYGEAGPIFYAADYVHQSGQVALQDLEARMLHLKLGVHFDSARKWKLHFIGHQDTGSADGSVELQTYQPLYYNHFDYAGRMNLFAWGNLTYYGVGLGHKFKGGQSLEFKVLAFKKSESGEGPFSISPSGNGLEGDVVTAALSQNQNKSTALDLGVEWDLLYTKSFKSSGLELSAFAGYFTPGAYLKTYGFTKGLYMARVTLGFEF